MHMNSAPHLLAEDRPEYERILADALRHAQIRPDPDEVGDRLNTEQLRTMALNATPLITAAAATEYDHYVKVRGEVRGTGTWTPMAPSWSPPRTRPAPAAQAPSR